MTQDVIVQQRRENLTNILRYENFSNITSYFFSFWKCQRHRSVDTALDVLTNEEKQKAIQGIWAENKEDNAWYWIKNDSVFFVEQQDKPIPYEFKNDTLFMIFEGYISKDRVIRLTLDSLWIEADTPTDTIKLYKRR